MTELLVHVVPRGGTSGNLSARSTLEHLHSRIGEVGDSINRVADGLMQRLRPQDRESGPWRMEQVTVAFTLDLQAEAGVIVSKTSLGAGFEVTVTWSSQDAAVRTPEAGA